MPFNPTKTKQLADLVHSMFITLNGTSDSLMKVATSDKEWEAAQALRSAAFDLFNAQAKLLVAIHWTQDCAACMRDREAGGQHDVSPSEMFDPASKTWLCSDCYDAAYSDPYTDTGTRRSDF